MKVEHERKKRLFRMQSGGPAVITETPPDLPDSTNRLGYSQAAVGQNGHCTLHCNPPRFGVQRQGTAEGYTDHFLPFVDV